MSEAYRQAMKPKSLTTAALVISMLWVVAIVLYMLYTLWNMGQA